MELSRNSGYTFEELLDKPFELVKVMIQINAEINLRNTIQKSKFNAIANRIDNDKLINFDEVIDFSTEEEEKKKPTFNIRELEKLHGFKVTRIKKGK